MTNKTDRTALVERLRELVDGHVLHQTDAGPITAAVDMLEADAQPKCSDHPAAPHGFNRDSSHTLGRYVCDCEGWQPDAVPQEPVAWTIHGWAIQGCSRMWKGEYAEIDAKAEAARCGGTCYAYPIYAAPPQRPRLTDAEIEAIAHRTATKYTHRSDPSQHSYGFVRHTLIDFARKVRGET